MTDNKSVKKANKNRLSLVLWLLFAVTAFFVMGAAGSAGGYQSAQVDWSSTQSALEIQSLVEQYTLGLQDLEDGRFDIARQRFEYVLAQDPTFPGATDKLAASMQVLFATSTPTPIPPTVTPTPTRDLRPVEDLFGNVTRLYNQGDWSGAIDAIVALRQTDSNYRVVEVDGILYRSLRNRGMIKIKEEGNLEGGIYDLTLAEGIGLLDAEALTYRDLARYYMMGSGFWEVYPEQAIYYFGMVASAAPYLHDLSGWTAAARYQAAIVQYADKLARDGDWCSAQEQYELASSYGGNASLQETAVYAAEKCSPPTDTPQPITDTPIPSDTPSATTIIIDTPIVTPSSAIPTTSIPSLTPTVPPQITIMPTTTATEQITLTPTVSATIVPSDTAIPTVAPTATDTTVPSPSDTPSPTLPPTEAVDQTPITTTEGLASTASP